LERKYQKENERLEKTIEDLRERNKILEKEKEKLYTEKKHFKEENVSVKEKWKTFVSNLVKISKTLGIDFLPK